MLKFIRSGTFQIQEAEGVQLGTKIVIHLKTECREYADDQKIQGTTYKYLLDNYGLSISNRWVHPFYQYGIISDKPRKLRQI